MKARQRLEALRRENPTFQPWLALIDVMLDSLAHPAWEAAAREVTPGPGLPVLVGATIPVDGGAVRELIDRLLAAAPDSARGEARALGWDGPRWLHAALGMEDAPLPADLEPIAELAAVPLLHACARRFSDRCASWSEGDCPICGAWPTLSEQRGLDAARRMRCGRCGADWGLQPLLCPFCGNSDHEKLRSLVPERAGDSRRIEACDVCLGYVKSLAQLTRIPPEQLPLEDLASVDLDMAAVERGFSRPEAPRRPLAARIVERG